MSVVNATALPKHATVVAKHEYADVETRACTFAMRKIDDALCMIGAAYTHHEGIYGACLDCLLDLDEIDELPPAARELLVKFVSLLVPISDMDRADQARAIVASLTASDALQFIDDLLSLRIRLGKIHISMSEATH